MQLDGFANMVVVYSCGHTRSSRSVTNMETEARGGVLEPMLTKNGMQPYLDSDMQSRWFDFGGDTIVRTDSYVLQPTQHQAPSSTP